VASAGAGGMGRPQLGLPRLRGWMTGIAIGCPDHTLFLSAFWLKEKNLRVSKGFWFGDSIVTCGRRRNGSRNPPAPKANTGGGRACHPEVRVAAPLTSHSMTSNELADKC
jgi:hypothetical protein